jgi:hypothetical protein
MQICADIRKLGDERNVLSGGCPAICSCSHQDGISSGLYLYTGTTLSHLSLWSMIERRSIRVYRLSADQIGLHVSTCSDDHRQKLELTVFQLHRRKPFREALLKAAAEPAENATRRTISRSHELLGYTTSLSYQRTHVTSSRLQIRNPLLDP